MDDSAQPETPCTKAASARCQLLPQVALHALVLTFSRPGHCGHHFPLLLRPTAQSHPGLARPNRSNNKQPTVTHKHRGCIPASRCSRVYGRPLREPLQQPLAACSLPYCTPRHFPLVVGYMNTKRGRSLHCPLSCSTSIWPSLGYHLPGNYHNVCRSMHRHVVRRGRSFQTCNLRDVRRPLPIRHVPGCINYPAPP
jgi:hypothetical protein